MIGAPLALGILIAQLTIGPALGRGSEFAGQERLQEVTGTFHSEALGAAAGFDGANEPCVESPDGGMGIHYVNRARIEDGVIDRDKPEILLYAPAVEGEPRLVAVEYLQADADQNLETDGDRPTLFGQPFNGPMEGHAPGMPIHYDLHVWLWKKNPSGMFAPFNPNVSC
jgi:hypothetical protein